MFKGRSILQTAAVLTGVLGAVIPTFAEHQLTRIEPGTQIVIRTNEYIDNSVRDNRIYTGTVERNVHGGNGRLAIPRGSQVEMIVRTARDRDLVLDLESVVVNGKRYAVDTGVERIESREGLGQNKRTAEHVGGGALLGTIIGAIAGGGKGAAIGAAAGAAAGAGAQVITQGRRITVPAESLLTFRVDRPMLVSAIHRGADRDGYHYHDYDNRDYDRDQPVPPR